MTGDAPQTVALSLVAHTNVGKTTLARTLLGRDIGEVRDEAHVTLEAERQTMIETPEGDRLELWDTPGFGDSVRLAKRLALAGTPIGWFLAQVWDRFRDRAMWSSQQAVRTVLEQADVVLYLVNASEQPEDVGYLDAELRVLDLLAKPVVVLLNQLGPPRSAEAEAADVERWRERVRAAPSVRAVLALDAFARCWVQEGALLDAVHAALQADKREPFDRLHAAWAARGRATWQAAMAELARRLARAALDREPVPAGGLAGRLRDIAGGAAPQQQLAMRTLAERLQADVRASTDRLIALHGLDGRAAAQVLARLAEHYDLRAPLSEGRAALLGGALAGALAGLKADLATGGFSLGGGMLVGSVLGALGGAGAARGINKLRGTEQTLLAWSDAALDAAVRAALLGYLAVAHHGRGRGAWAEAEAPPFWLAMVDAAVEERRAWLKRIWAARAAAAESADGEATLARELGPWFEDASRALLLRLYPAAGTTSALNH